MLDKMYNTTFEYNNHLDILLKEEVDDCVPLNSLLIVEEKISEIHLFQRLILW